MKTPKRSNEDVVEEFFELQGKNTYRVREGKVDPHVADENERRYLRIILTEKDAEAEKAREEEREKKANELQEMLDGPYSQAIYSWRPDDYVAFIRKVHHSELNQPINSIFKE